MTPVIRDAMSLWLDIEPGADLEAELRRFSICRQALDDFLALQISLDDYLDTLSSWGVNVDDYQQTADDNLGLVL